MARGRGRYEGIEINEVWSRSGQAYKMLQLKIDTQGDGPHADSRAFEIELDGTVVFSIDKDGVQRSNNTPVNATAATLAVSRASHANRVVTLNRAAGITATLPAATGSGDRYTFFTGTTVTSNNNIIQVTGNDTMKGLALMAADGGDTMVAFETAVDSDTITMNGSTKGGIIGDLIELIDVAADVWSVQCRLSGTGTEATPFSAAVT